MKKEILNRLKNNETFLKLIIPKYIYDICYINGNNYILSNVKIKTVIPKDMFCQYLKQSMDSMKHNNDIIEIIEVEDMIYEGNIKKFNIDSLNIMVHNKFFIDINGYDLEKHIVIYATDIEYNNVSFNNKHFSIKWKQGAKLINKEYFK